MFRLSEKCLQVVERNLDGLPDLDYETGSTGSTSGSDDQSHTTIALDRNCAKLVVVLVKRVDLGNEQFVREAINYDYYEINHNIG